MANHGARLGTALGIAALAAAVLVWRCRDADPDDDGSSTSTTTQHVSTSVRARTDPRTLDRASLAGTVTDGAKQPLAAARVCATATSDALPTSLLDEPHCTVTDAAGRYTIAPLFAADYTVAAMAKPYRPEQLELRLAAGEHRVHADIVLDRPGVEITGTVEDVSGGPIAHAYVRDGIVVETDARGAFALWVAPAYRLGHAEPSLEAWARGYAHAKARASTASPVTITLVPEASIAGMVIDATTREPVEGASVDAYPTTEAATFEPGADLTDAQGRFQITGLHPDRYALEVTASHGHGKSQGSYLVGVGQSVANVVLLVHAAHSVSGRVVIAGTKTACRGASAELEEVDGDRGAGFVRDAAETLHADGVFAGTYKVSVSCPGHLSSAPAVVLRVADADIVGQEWQVEPGSTIRGRVTLASGAPVVNVRVEGTGLRDERDEMAVTTTSATGAYELVGLAAGDYLLSAEHPGTLARERVHVTVPAHGEVTRDLVLDAAAEITGSITGYVGELPIGFVKILRVGVKSTDRFDGYTSIDAARHFRMTVTPGDYVVTAGTQERTVTARIGSPVDVSFTFDQPHGAITGNVVDERGNPVADAYVDSAKERGHRDAMTVRWTPSQPPHITAVDGTFKLDDLAIGTYTILVHRRGGGEAIASHVSTGTSISVVITPTGSISGRVTRDGKPPEQFYVVASRLAVGIHREETFFRNDGRYTIDDLPPGSYVIGARVRDGYGAAHVELAAGERKTDVDLSILPPSTLTGRIVDLSHAPIAGVRVEVTSDEVLGALSMDAFLPRTTDADGRFNISGLRSGSHSVRVDRDGYDGRETSAILRAGSNDVGELVLRPSDSRPGRFGIDVDLTAPHLLVKAIDPAGPAAKTQLRVGDVITSIGPYDVSRMTSRDARYYLRGHVGEEVKLVLARGVTVTIVLGPTDGPRQ